MTESPQAASPERSSRKSAQAIPLSLCIDPASMTKLLDLLREALEPMIAKALSQVQPAISPPQPATEAPPPNASATKGVDLKPPDQIRAADLRVALLMGKIPEDSGLLVDAKILARLLNISKSTFYRLQDEEAIPAPVTIGQLKNWRLAEILEWIEADCPPQRVWVHKRQDSSRRKGK